MTALETYDKWLRMKKQDKYGWNIQKVIEKAEELGYDVKHVRKKVQELRLWLSANEGTKKVMKKHWGKFTMKNMGDFKKQQRSGRVVVSKFHGPSRVED